MSAGQTRTSPGRGLAACSHAPSRSSISAGSTDRFLAEGLKAQVAGFASVRLDISDFPTRHPYGLGLWQNHIERILAGWVGELRVPIHYGNEVTGFAQDDAGVDIALSDGRSLRAQYLVGCDGGRSLIRKAAGIEFPGWDATTSALLAEVDDLGEQGARGCVPARGNSMPAAFRIRLRPHPHIIRGFLRA